MTKTSIKLFKKTLSITLAFLIAILLIPNFDFKVKAVNWIDSADTTWYYGHQSDTTFSISTANQLAGFAKLVNEFTSDFSGKTINLTADIVLNDTSDWQNWGTTPPANAWTAIGASPFYGTFDGNGHTVSGIYINSTNARQGLFGRSFGTVKNVGVINSYIKGLTDVGGVVGENAGGTVTNCYNKGTVIGTFGSTGGVNGSSSNGTVSNCYNTGAVTSGSMVGGVVGLSDGNISNCYNTGIINGSNIVGGVVGNNGGNSSKIENSHNEGKVNGTGTNIGGVAGGNNGIISKSYNTGAVNGNSHWIGGVAGRNYNTIENCYNTGAVTGNGNSVGGITGYSELIVKNSFNTGAVEGKANFTGGIVGGNNPSSTIENCYNTGVVVGVTNIGGVAGYNENEIINCYYYGYNVGIGGNGASQTGTTPFVKIVDNPLGAGKTTTITEQTTLAINTAWSNALGANFAVAFSNDYTSSDTSKATISGTTISGVANGNSTFSGRTMTIKQNGLTAADFDGDVMDITVSISLPLSVNSAGGGTVIVNAVSPSFSNTNIYGETTYTKNDKATALNGDATVSDGGTVTYKWYKNTTNSTTGGTEISGATNATYTPPTDIVGTSYYYVIATNTNNSVIGTKTATSISGIKKVIVNNPAVIETPKTVEVIETPAEIKNPEKISVKPIGEAFSQSVEVRMKDDPTVKKAIEDSLDKVLKSNLKDATVFPLDISLYVKGTDTKIQPNEGTSVVITIPIPESLLANKDSIKVVCIINDKLTVLDTNVIQIDGVWCVQFSATHFSPYAMVVDTANELSNTTNPKTSGNNAVGTFSIIAILSVATLAVARKKYKFKVVK